MADMVQSSEAAEACGPVEPLANESNPALPPIPYVTILIGLLLGFGLLLGLIPRSVYHGLEGEMSLMAAWGTMTVISKVVVLVALPLYVMYWERQSLSSIGVYRPGAADVGYGRGFEYALIIAPSQVLLVLLYLWRRNLSACVIAHILASVRHGRALAAVARCER